MDVDLRRLKASLQLFDKLECCSNSMNGDSNDVDAALVLIDIDKMRCLVIDCLTAIHLVLTEKNKNEAVVDKDNYELVKSRVFNAAIAMIVDDEFSSNEVVVKKILSSFPSHDENEISEENNWLHQHFAIALGVRDKISEDDICIMLSMDQLATHQLSKTEADALILYEGSGRCALHLVAQYSESLELLENILRIDHKMTKVVFTGKNISPLGLLCKSRHFPTFDAMILCLTQVDSSVEIVADGMVGHIRSYDKYLYQDISPGSRGANSLLFLRGLLDLNPAVTK
jgi:hypothetical protein